MAAGGKRQKQVKMVLLTFPLLSVFFLVRPGWLLKYLTIQPPLEYVSMSVCYNLSK